MAWCYTANYEYKRRTSAPYEPGNFNANSSKTGETKERGTIVAEFVIRRLIAALTRRRGLLNHRIFQRQRLQLIIIEVPA